jgi:hypothetical protein
VPDAWSVWWAALCAAALLNATAWTWSAVRLGPRLASLPPDVARTRRRLLWLAGLYVLGCGFRSLLPMVDVPRLCLHETWASRIFIGRSVATIAELAFVAQWALLMREAGAVRAARLVVPLIAGAEVLSWIAVLTRNDLFHALENGTWTLVAAFAVAFLASRWRYEGPTGRKVIVAAAGATAAYILFMAAYVLPMYLARWNAGQEAITFAQGLAETLRPCIVQRDWALWWQDAAWLTPYFTLCVWFSISLAHVPSLKAGAAAADRRE